MPLPRRTVDYRVEPFDLQLFIAVVEHGSITAGAKAMSLSLAAASSRLSALEHRVGSPLLVRSKAGAAVTDAGRALVRQAHRVLAELDSLHVEMAAFGRGLKGKLRLLANTSAMSELLPSRIGAFLVDNPDIDLDLKDMPSDAVLEALHGGIADVGIVADHVDTRGLATQAWVDDELVALLPAERGTRASTDKAVTALSFARLLERPFVGLSAESGLSRFLQQQAARTGRLPHHRVRVGNFDAVAELVAAGVGVAVMPLSAAQRRRGQAVRVVPLKDAWAKRKLLICSTPQAQQLPGLRALIDALMLAASRRR